MDESSDSGPVSGPVGQRCRPARLRLRASAVSDTGLVRRNNEDSFVDDARLGLWLVADGMGGAGAGEVAAAIACCAVHRAVADGRSLAEGLQAAHRAIGAAALAGAGAFGMGTTAVALTSRGRHYDVAWVGDSRAYLWDLRQLTRITRDHSLVQELVDAGVIDEQAARTHPHRNIITRSLGAGLAMAPNVGRARGRWSPGQSMLLCSDGLCGELSDEEISAILAASLAPDDAVRQLCRAALDHGGRDNITAILVCAPAPAAPWRRLVGCLQRAARSLRSRCYAMFSRT